ncbi:hypothetical protein CHUAL_004666 [Chamberlinius hualienensis]
MKTIVAFGAIVCFMIIGAAAQTTESPLCHSIHEAMMLVRDTCQPNHPPSDEQQDALRSMVEACASESTIKEKADCFKRQLEQTGCRPPHHGH